MKTRAMLMGALVLMTSFAAFGDSYDDAEAKKQGISADAVRANRFKDQNDELRKQNADLQKKLDDDKKQMNELRSQIADLKAKVDQLNSSLSPAAKAKLGAQDAIATAINDHKIVNGMTVEQANQSLGIKFGQFSAGSDGEIYEGFVKTQLVKNSDGTHTQFGTKYTLRVVDGKVASWDAVPHKL